MTKSNLRKIIVVHAFDERFYTKLWKMKQSIGVELEIEGSYKIFIIRVKTNTKEAMEEFLTNIKLMGRITC